MKVIPMLFSPLGKLATMVLAGATASTLLVSNGTTSASDKGREMWKQAEEPLGEMLEVRTVTDWGSYKDGGSAYSNRIRELLDEAVRILSVSPTDNERDELRRIQDDIRKAQDEIKEIKSKMAMMPEDEGGIVGTLKGVVKPTRSGYAADIEVKEQEIVSLKNEATGVKRRFADDLAKIGISLTPDQVEGLLSLVTSDDLIQVMGVFENLKSVNGALLQATESSRESIETAQRYYGIYAVMLEIAVYMHMSFIDKVEREYMTRLGDIEKRTDETRSQAQGMLGKETDAALVNVLRSNVASLDLTKRAVGIYRQHLSRQRDMVKSSLDRIMRQRNVAVNTYKTVKVSSELVGMIRTTGQAFDALMKIEIPTLRPFESIQMKDEINRLTLELGKRPVS